MPSTFANVQERVKKFINSGQLGIFSHGYWGHKAMILPPEANLMATAHYLEALDYQRRSNQITAVLGAKTPHVQNLAVGGVANAINPDNQSALNMERLAYVKTLMDELGGFVREVYLPDVTAIAALYADWLPYGQGVTNYLSAPDFPRDGKGTDFGMPGGYIPNADLSQFHEITHFGDPYFEKNVKESIKHSWYQGDWTRTPVSRKRPSRNTPISTRTAPTPGSRRRPSWISRRRSGRWRMCWPGSRQGMSRPRSYLKMAMDRIGAITGSRGAACRYCIQPLGRHAARCVRTQVLYDMMQENYDALIAISLRAITPASTSRCSRRVSRWASASMRRRAASCRTGS